MILSQKIFSFRKKIFIILFFINIILYFNSLFFEFVWDDLVHLDVFNDKLKGFSDLIYFFKGPNVVGQPHYYRPLMLVSYGIDYLIYKENSFGYHLTSIVLHIFNVFLVYVITEKILKNREVAFCSAVIFSVLPVHSEAVVWISARADVLCSFFSFLSILYYLSFSENKRFQNIILTIFFYLLAILTKEVAVFLPLVFFIYDIYFSNLDKIKKIFYLVCILLTILFGVIRNIILPVAFGDNFPVIYKISTIPLIFLKYLELLFLPIDLRILYYHPRIQTTPNIISLIGWIVIFVYSLLIYYLYKKNRLLSFFLLFYIIFLLPVIGVITFVRVSLVGDRYLYFPSYGLVVFFSYWLFFLFNKLEKKKYLYYSYNTVLLFTFIVLLNISYNRNKDWSNQFVFLNKMKDDMPMYMPVYLHLGRYYFLKKDYQNAIFYFSLAEKYSSLEDKHIVHYNLGTVYSVMNNFEKAEEHFYISLMYKKDYGKSYYNLGALYFEDKQYDKCLEILEKGLNYIKDDPEFYNLSAVCANLVGEKEKALFYVEKAIDLNPKNEGYKQNLELILNGVR